MADLVRPPLTLNDDVLAMPEEAAELLKVGLNTLQKWRSTGEHNIPYIKIGRSVRYRVSDLKAYVESHVVGGAPSQLPDTVNPSVANRTGAIKRKTVNRVAGGV